MVDQGIGKIKIKKLIVSKDEQCFRLIVGRDLEVYFLVFIGFVSVSRFEGAKRKTPEADRSKKGDVDG